jgi:hypothetical protein
MTPLSILVAMRLAERDLMRCRGGESMKRAVIAGLGEV